MTIRRIGDPLVIALRSAMGERGVSQEALAEFVGISRQGMSKRLTCKVQFKAGELARAMYHLDVSADRIFQGALSQLAGEEKATGLSDRHVA